MQKIIFYNHYHNGDIFLSKPYIKHIMDLMPEVDFFYFHKNNQKIILDLNIKQKNLNDFYINDNLQSFVENDILFINTHIGRYFPEIEDAECNWITTHKVYEKIYKTISEHFSVELKTKNMRDYLYEVDYRFYDIPKNLNLDYSKTFIISNGPVHSGQSNLNSLDFLIEYLANKYEDITFILTHKTNIAANNILYTDDLIETNGSDLNEIVYIADKHCKYIMGRQSGPFTFMGTDSILNNKNKVIFSLRHNRNCEFLYNLKAESKYFSILDTDINYIFDIIEKNIGG